MFLRLIFTSFFLISHAFSLCPPNSNVSSSGTCYKAFSQSLAWFDADAACVKDGGHLANIPDVFTNSFIASVAKGTFGVSDYWIGGFGFQNAKQNVTFWQWIDHNSFKYTNWAKGQPVNSDVGFCAAQHTITSQWSSIDCNTTKFYVCEYSNSSTICPNSNWTHVTAFGGKCYYIGSEEFTWYNAFSACEMYPNTMLASIHSAVENRLVTSYILATIGDKDTWLGLYDYNKNGTYTWVDTTPVDYINGDSSTNPGLCVTYACSRDSCWSWGDCNTQYNYLCEYLENPPPHKATSPSASIHPSTNPCPTDWTYFNQTHKCYTYATGSSWSDVRGYCQFYGGDLVSIHSEIENNFLLTIANPNGDTYIGLYSPNQDNSNWVWIDGTSLNFTSWGGDEPYQDCGIEYCAVLRSLNNTCVSAKNGHWVAEGCARDSCNNCQTRQGGICELSVNF